MQFEWMNEATTKELEQFKTVCSRLLGRTYLPRTLISPDRGNRISNPDYNFLNAHFDQVSDYLSLLGWEIRKEGRGGYFYVISVDNANRCILSKEATAILLALRLLYDERLGDLGTEQDALCTVQDVLDKVVTEYAILPQKPNRDEVRRILTLLDNHSIIQRLDGKYNEPACRFAILPTVVTAVPGERLNAVVSALKREEKSEGEGHEET